jgi:hypothetical protein
MTLNIPLRFLVFSWKGIGTLPLGTNTLARPRTHNSYSCKQNCFHIPHSNSLPTGSLTEIPSVMATTLISSTDETAVLCKRPLTDASATSMEARRAVPMPAASRTSKRTVALLVLKLTKKVC